ncbi:MAG TPA: iron permease, partial [Gammaproteobacteria bacterium]
ALWTQVRAGQSNILLAGLLGGAAVLAVLAWMIVRYSIRLPLKRFFSITVYVLLVLSFVLMGKAVIALQEAGFIGVTPFPLHLTLEWFGIYPTWEGIGAQALVLLLSLTMLFLPNATAANRTSLSGQS